ncbi:MAG: Rv2175c family DNA-binding protein [Sciscionella sp.]
MSAIPLAEDVLEPAVAVMPLSVAAGKLGQPVSKLRQWLHEGHLLAVRRDRELVVPAALINGDGLVKGLVGTLTVLSDSGFTPTEALRWLFTEDDSLPGSPIEALRGNRGREVKRRAQASAL